VSRAVAKQQFEAIRHRAGFELNSRLPFQEVSMPLLFHNGLPYAKASWSGRQIACLVDTGSSTIMWPQWLHLDTQQLNISSIAQWPEGRMTRTEWVPSPRISIGDIILSNVPTKAIGFPKPTPSDPNIGYFPVLGMFAFSPGVMTIDYAHKRLIVRNRD